LNFATLTIHVENLDIIVGQFNQNPYIRGAISIAVVGSTSADFHNLQGRVGALFFAGEATHEHYRKFVQGGYVTGLKQAKAISSCLNNEGCPQYEPEDSDLD
jgi:polyamine oxidase